MPIFKDLRFTGGLAVFLVASWFVAEHALVSGLLGAGAFYMGLAVGEWKLREAK